MLTRDLPAVCDEGQEPVSKEVDDQLSCKNGCEEIVHLVKDIRQHFKYTPVLEEIFLTTSLRRRDIKEMYCD